MRGPQLEEFNKLNQLSEETRERRVLDWLNKNEDVECEEEGRPLSKAAKKLKQTLRVFVFLKMFQN